SLPPSQRVQTCLTHALFLLCRLNHEIDDFTIVILPTAATRHGVPEAPIDQTHTDRRRVFGEDEAPALGLRGLQARVGQFAGAAPEGQGVAVCIEMLLAEKGAGTT